MTKIDHSLFNAREHALDTVDGLCPLCNSALVVRHSKNGPFVGCSSYPSCNFIKPLHDTHTTVLKVMTEMGCPLCDKPLAIKKGRYGMFIGCSGFPDCHYITKINQSENTHVQCPKCQQGELKERTNKYGKRFFACDNYPACRYVLNFEPVNKTCEKCGWPVLVNKKGVTECPQPSCDYRVSE